MSRRTTHRLAHTAIVLATLFALLFLASVFSALSVYPTPTSSLTLARGRIESKWAADPSLISNLHLRRYDFEWGYTPRVSFQGWHSSGKIYNHVAVPLWPICVILVASAIYLFRRTRLKGHCPHCQYDLKGLPSAAPCPECGKPPD